MRAIIRISGGIGNQVFQLGFGDHLSRKYNFEIIYDVSFYSSTVPNSTKRDFIGHLLYPKGNYENRSILDLELGYEVAQNSFWNKFSIKTKYLLLGVQHLLKNRFVIHHSEKIFWGWRIFGSHLTHVFLGNWQNFEFLNEEFKLEILRNLEIASEPISSIDLDEFIGVHIRRGDYSNNGSIHQIIKEAYYLEALNFLGAISGRRRILLFSDDNSRSLDSKEIGEITLASSLTQDDLTQLLLMSRLKYLVIANSTFSAIAALIGEIDKQVVVPTEWFHRGVGIDVPLLPKSWHRIS